MVHIKTNHTVCCTVHISNTPINPFAYMKKIVIIGASSGIGERLAKDFARMGYMVGIAARRENKLKEIKSEFPENIVYETIDVTAGDAVAKLNALISKTGGMDTFLMASGVGFEDEMQDETLDKVLKTNVVGFARMLAAAYRFYRDNDRQAGQIAAITSVAGEKGMGSLPAYSASKRFDRTFMDALEQLSHENKLKIDFTDIRPGFIRTDLLNPDRPYPMLMSLDHAVPLIEKAILKKKRVAYIDWRYALLAAAWRLAPRALWVRMSSKRFS